VRLVAGIDVGNTTTEVVVADTSVQPPEALLWDRAPTRGVKGSVQALHGAALLLRRLERTLDSKAELIVAAPQRPVVTRALSFPETPPPTGRLAIVRTGGSTPGRTGTAAGRPQWTDDAPTSDGQPVVLLCRPGTGFSNAVAATRRWLDAGAAVVGLLLADDEGVLVSARLPIDIPVMDEVDVESAAHALLVALEVRPGGHTLQDLSDPIRLGRILELPDGQRGDAIAITAQLGDASHGVVALHTTARPVVSTTLGQITMRETGDVQALTGSALSGLTVGAVARCWLPGAESSWAIDDLWVVELREIAASVAARIDRDTARALVVAGLSTDPPIDPADVLASEHDAPVRILGPEAGAARAGALSTPGSDAGATVVDLGGGTIDVIAPDGSDVVAAGAGEMLTEVVAGYLRLPRGAADWVKRGPCSRVEAPQILLAENGTRSFLDHPAPVDAVGLLVVPGPAGLLPFGAALAPAEWRALRVRSKERVLVDNVLRALRGSGQATQDIREIVLAGGVAADEELVGLLARRLEGCAVGRADVAGRLGHRYAVAYGLILMNDT